MNSDSASNHFGNNNSVSKVCPDHSSGLDLVFAAFHDEPTKFMGGLLVDFRFISGHFSADPASEKTDAIIG